MATIKVFSLLIKTLSKPIANSMKSRAQDHPKFRKICVGVAQSLHRYETRLSSGIFSKIQPTIRPLSDTKAIQNGANFLSEAFLFTVALGLIVGENLRGRIQTANRRDKINERLEELEQSISIIKLSLCKFQFENKSIEPYFFWVGSVGGGGFSSGQVELQNQLNEIKTYQEDLNNFKNLNENEGSIKRRSGLNNSIGIKDDELVERAEIALGWRKP